MNSQSGLRECRFVVKFSTSVENLTVEPMRVLAVGPGEQDYSIKSESRIAKSLSEPLRVIITFSPVSNLLTSRPSKRVIFIETSPFLN